MEMVFPSIPRERVLGAVAEVLEWQMRSEPWAANSVLNACRAWRFAAEGRWSSKTEAAAWARPRSDDPEVVDAALALRLDPNLRRLDSRRVLALLARARRAVAAAGS